MNDVRLRGQAADSPENDYLAPGRARVSPDGQLAAGHRPGGALVAGREGMTQHLDYQQVAPSAAVTLRQVADRPGPLADAIVGHEAMARVQQQDQMRASAPGLAPQLGARAPSPVPGQPPQHTVATDRGAPARGVVPSDPVALYLTGPRGARQ